MIRHVQYHSKEVMLDKRQYFICNELAIVTTNFIKRGMNMSPEMFIEKLLKQYADQYNVEITNLRITDIGNNEKQDIVKHNSEDIFSIPQII